MSEYEVSVWVKFARSARTPLPRIKQYAIQVEADDVETAARVAYEAESTPQRSTSKGLSRSQPRALPRVYVEIETETGVHRRGDFALKLETRARQKVTR